MTRLAETSEATAQRRRQRLALPLLTLLLLASRAYADPDPNSIVPANSDTAVAATEERLWLAVNVIDVESSGGVLFTRVPERDFEFVNRLNTRVLRVLPFNDECFLFLADRTIYRQPLNSLTLSAVRSLPANGLPLDVAASRNRILVLVDGRTAAAIRDPGVATRPSVAVPAAESFAVATLESNTWRIVAECDGRLSRSGGPGLSPRLLADEERLLVASVDTDPKRLNYAWYNRSTGDWTAPQQLGPLDAAAAGFWLVRVGGTPTLIISLSGDTGPRLAVFRWLAVENRPGEFAWRPAEAQIGGLPEGGKPTAFEHAFGFNQHFGLVVRDAKNKLYLMYGRIDGPPLEPAVSIEEAISKPARQIQMQNGFQLGTLVALGLILGLLFGFRRTSLSTPVKLPAGIAPALLIPRLIAALIDFAPFSLAAARATDVPLRDALATLADWTLQTDITTPAVRPFVWWWGMSCFGYILYSLLMELIVRRTVGKMLLGLRVTSESGGRASILAILGRNLLRLLELFPYFWVFAILPLWSRNRQRLGDIFARTLVIRAVDVESAEKRDDSSPT